MAELFVIEYLTALGMTMVLLFLDSRFSRCRTVLTFFSATVLIMAAVAAIYRIAGIRTTLLVYPLIAHIPSLLLLLIFSRFRGWRLIFQLLSAILFCTLIQHGAGLAYYLSGRNIWVLILSYAFLTGGITLFLIRILRPLFLQTLLNLHSGWWLMCLVLTIYYIIVIYLIPGYVGIVKSSTILKPSVSLLITGFYSILIFLFSSTRREAEARYSAQLSTMQLSALQSRMEAVKAAEDVIRTERHDLRHRLQAAAELVAQGDTDAALKFLDAAQRRLDEHTATRWCRPPVLNAVFSSYFSQARNQGIEVHAAISLPDTLPADEGELAIVLANALENAIHANMELPREQRQIRCRIVGIPGIILELSNPCNTQVTFDSHGLPVAQRENHGLGVRSVSAFCQKYDAVYQFDLTDGWFRLRLVL